MDDNSALVLGTRLFYLAAGGVFFGFQCDVAVGGCNTDSWYMQHPGRRRRRRHARQRHAAHGGDPRRLQPPRDRLRRAPAHEPRLRRARRRRPAKPVGHRQRRRPERDDQLDAGRGATEYWVLRTDGVHGCNFGKTRVARIPATSPLTFTAERPAGRPDLLLQRGGGRRPGRRPGRFLRRADERLRRGDAAAAERRRRGPASAVEDTGAAPVIETGDGDPFVDNCEIARPDLQRRQHRRRHRSPTCGSLRSRPRARRPRS